LFISCGFCCGKKSAGIPKDLLADLVLRRITCGFGVFRKIRRYFLRIFLRFLSPGRLFCGFGAFRKICRYF
jgi:hypothetical protein